MRQLRSAGANLQGVSTSEGWSALHIAARNGHLQVVKWLLDEGTDKSMFDKNKRSTLDLATEQGNTLVIEALK